MDEYGRRVHEYEEGSEVWGEAFRLRDDWDGALKSDTGIRYAPALALTDRLGSLVEHRSPWLESADWAAIQTAAELVRALLLGDSIDASLAVAWCTVCDEPRYVEESHTCPEQG